METSMKLIGSLCWLLVAAVPLAAQSRANRQVPGSFAEMSQAPSRVQSRVLDTYGRLPLAFEANQGQTDPQVKFVSRGTGYNLFLTATEAMLALRKGSGHDHNASATKALPRAEASAGLHMKRLGANSKPDALGKAE